MNAVLIIIGDEILSGSTFDTNSNFISNELKNIGIKIEEIYTISDSIDTIKATLQIAFDKTDLVITTGGLGPTRDDKTKIAFADFFEDEIVFDENTFEHLRKYLEKRKRADILEQNRSQAEVFAKGKVFLNDFGTAPCLMNEKNGKMAFCLPGVPYEVKPLIKDKILPFVKEHFKRNFILTRIISVVGIPESILALQIEPWELALPKNFSLSYLPIGTRIKLKITAFGDHSDELKNKMENQIAKLVPFVEKNILSTEGEKIEEILKTVLMQRNLTISTSESCTGGQVSKLITSVPGSSTYFLGGVCTYQSEKKTSILGVSEELIQEKSVVSAEVAEAMSLGCQALFGTDISVSTTGVAGPNSDDQNNEIGLVYYSVRIGNEVKTAKLFLPYMDRVDFMEFVAQKVLQEVVELLVLK